MAACALLALGSVASLAQDEPLRATDAAEWQAFLDANCVSCHSQSMQAGGLVLAGAALEPIGPNADIWERVAAKLSAGEMPPPTVQRRPDPHQSAAFIAGLVGRLDAYASANPDPGRPVIRRLTRVEYANAVRDLLDIEIEFADDLPPDLVAEGFDNNGEALSVTSLMLEKYASAARTVSRAAVSDPSLPRVIKVFEAPDRQVNWRPGVPLGARGGPVVEEYFPIGGEYIIRVSAGPQAAAPIESQAVFTAQTTLEAGRHRIAAMVAEDSGMPIGAVSDVAGRAGRRSGPLDALGSTGVLPRLDIRVDDKLVKTFEVLPPSEDDIHAPGGVIPGVPWIRRIEINGPVSRIGGANTASRARIFTCQPSTVAAEDDCAREILGATLRRAFRRDVSDADVRPFMALFERSRTRADFEIAIQESLEAILVAPQFLFRVEEDPPAAEAGIYAIDEFELASRLSFFLWSSIPDDRLLDLASAGRLSDPDVLRAEAERMLADPRADMLAQNFGLQFLGLRELEAMEADAAAYPDFSLTLREQFVEETRLFVRDLLRSNSSITDLIGANYTYLNPDLADHYGIDGVEGPGFRKVSFASDSVRGGVLGQGSVLLVTSHPNITAPVLRGKWVLSNLLDQPPAPPPPGVPALEPENAAGEKLTGREQMELHRSNPVCASCHSRMDPFGFALENFDVTGRWRTSDESGPVDPAVSLPTGASFEGVVGLRKYLVSQDQDLARAFTSKLMTYALGRRLGPADASVVRGIVADTAPQQYRFQDIALEIVTSTPFRMRRKEEQP